MGDLSGQLDASGADLHAGCEGRPLTGVGKRVCVTGASGYIACHIVRALLERGYHVRGTVRNPNDAAKVAHIVKLAEATAGSLELVGANLTEDGSFDSAVAGCEYVVHVASPVVLKAKDPQREIVDPMVKGCLNVMHAVLKARCARRVVMTSATAAVFDDHLKPNHVYTEEDWNEYSTVETEPYPLGKALAERAAWKVYDQQPKDGSWRFELVTMLPGVALGPVCHRQHLTTSPQVVQQLLNGSMVMAPNLRLAAVDVRDCAQAHVAGLENPQASGRYILCTKTCSFLEIAKVLCTKYSRTYRVPTRQAPDWLVYLIALFHPQISWEFLRVHLGVDVPLSNAKAERELGIHFRPVEESILDTASSLIEHNFVFAK